MNWKYSLLILLASCSQMDRAENERVRKCNEKKEAIYRLDQEKAFVEVVTVEKRRDKYPWEEVFAGSFAKINKEYFRCKGSDINPPRTKEEICDCVGAERHDQKDIYPVLIDLLNYIQERAQSNIVITTGYRCPEHNRYADPSKIAQNSKHQMGAEVDFYVEHFENKPLKIIEWIMSYYQYNASEEYNKFTRMQKNPERLRHPGWYNKEIALRIHEKGEGRDFDNRHPYPYITIEVRFDKVKNQSL